MTDALRFAATICSGPTSRHRADGCRAPYLPYKTRESEEIGHCSESSQCYLNKCMLITEASQGETPYYSCRLGSHSICSSADYNFGTSQPATVKLFYFWEARTDQVMPRQAQLSALRLFVTHHDAIVRQTAVAATPAAAASWDHCRPTKNPAQGCATV
jgi:hypothetical protein